MTPGRMNKKNIRLTRNSQTRERRGPNTTQSDFDLFGMMGIPLIYSRLSSEEVQVHYALGWFMTAWQKVERQFVPRTYGAIKRRRDVAIWNCCEADHQIVARQRLEEKQRHRPLPAGRWARTITRDVAVDFPIHPVRAVCFDAYLTEQCIERTRRKIQE